MKKLALILSVLIFMAGLMNGQMSQQARDSINRLTEQDHQLMMKRLSITELRPGPSGNPQDPNYANTDESKAIQYTSLPDPLIFNNGTHVNSAKQWERRRQEIFEDFDREVYGRLPKEMPAVTWKLISEKDTMNGEFPVQPSTEASGAIGRR